MRALCFVAAADAASFRSCLGRSSFAALRARLSRLAVGFAGDARLLRWPIGAAKSASACAASCLAQCRAARAVSTSSDRAFVQVAEIETARTTTRISRVTCRPRWRKHVAHLAVLAFADREREPDIRALLAVERRFDRPVVDAVDGDAVAQRVERLLPHLAVRAHAIAAQPPGRRQFEHARKPAVIGEQQQAFGIDVEPADADQPRQVFRQRPEDRVAPLRIGMRGHQAARLVIEEKPRALARPQAACRRPRSGRDGVTLSAGEEITAPLTATRPAAIQASASRRERKARARDDFGDALAGPFALSEVLPYRLCFANVFIHGAA